MPRVIGIGILVQPLDRNFTGFHAFSPRGKKLGEARLFTRDAEAILYHVNTEGFKGGKGSGASLELIKARVVHAFRNPGVRRVSFNLPSHLLDGENKAQLQRVLGRYLRFGFKRVGTRNEFVLSREAYKRISERGIYKHLLVREIPSKRKV